MHWECKRESNFGKKISLVFIPSKYQMSVTRVTVSTNLSPKFVLKGHENA